MLAGSTLVVADLAETNQMDTGYISENHKWGSRRGKAVTNGKSNLCKTRLWESPDVCSFVIAAALER